MERAFELGDRRVDEILTPRTEIVAVEADTTIREALDTAVASGHRRLPIYNGDLDDVSGVVRLQDLAAAITERPDEPVTTVATDQLVVPETKRVVELLGEMQATGVYLALAVDEHGGTEGIVTIEDVVAELVGRVSDEGELLNPIRPGGPGRWHVDAAADLEELEQETGVSLPSGDWHTVGGLVIGVAGRIPSVGESFDFDRLRLTVRAAEPHRVAILTAALIDQPPSS